MRRTVLLYSLVLTVFAGPSLFAQSLWSPCGCDGRCGSCATNDCQTCGYQGCCWRPCDPAYFQPWNCRPFGQYNEHMYQAQRQSGLKSQFAFYDFHFALDETNGTWKLNQSGLQNAQTLSRLWAECPSQIIVEPIGRSDWDDARRELILQAMANNGVPLTGDAVVLGRSHVLGLVPSEPETIYWRRQELSPFMQGYSPTSSVGAGGANSSSAAGSSVNGDSAGMLPNN